MTQIHHEEINQLIFGDRKAFTTREWSNDSNDTSSSKRDRSPIESRREILSSSSSKPVRQQILNAWSLAKIEWSQNEKFALIQRTGGPCCILAPIQAYIISLLKDFSAEQEGHQDSDDNNIELTNTSSTLNYGYSKKTVLYKAICKIFENILNANESESGLILLCTNLRGKYTQVNLKILQQIDSEDLSDHDKCLVDGFYDLLQKDLGILHLLYSFVASKGISRIIHEMGQIQETPQLLDQTNGHGEQSLLNLLLTGRASSHVHDGDRNTDGLILSGTSERSNIGLLCIHEAYKYLQVGENYKTPIYPIWILGSENHYTVFWTNFKIASKSESCRSQYRKILMQYQTSDECGFISKNKLKDVLEKCDLVNDIEYIEYVKQELDPDNLGIIMINTFLDYFAEGELEEHPQAPPNFCIYHYNGRPESNIERKIIFRSGTALMVDWQNDGIASNDLERILQTKWRNIQLSWEEEDVPNVN